MRRHVLLLLLTLSACGGGSAPTAAIEIIEVGGYLDDARLEYVRDSIEEAAAAGRELAILQIDSAAVVGTAEQLAATVELVADPPLPLVVWLGPAPAEAGGGVEAVLGAAPLVAAAPGTTTTARIDRESASLRQLVQDLDGVAIGEFPPVRTLTTDLPDYQEGVTNRPVTFTQPGLWHRFTHLGATPEGAFFFLVLGLTLAAFEYYALGPGVAAVVAALSLFLGAYGISILPISPFAISLAIAGIWLLATSYQKGGVLALVILGTGLLVWSAVSFSASPAVGTGLVGVTFSILAVLFFFVLALPALGRARLSTQNIGREGLVGQGGRALADFAPEGVVEIEGARWPATAHREAGIRGGDWVVVTAVAGREVEVEKPPE